MTHERRSHPAAIKIAVLVFAATLMTGFVISEAHLVLHRPAHALLVDSPETEPRTMLPSTKAVIIEGHDEPLRDSLIARNRELAAQELARRQMLVVDRYGSRHMITLDSLERRVNAQRYVLPSSKAIRTHSWVAAEHAYLDSLLNVTGTTP